MRPDVKACIIDAYITLGPEDTGAEHERKRKFVALEQSPRNRAIYSLRALV